MFFLSCHLNPSRPVAELHDVVDLDNAPLVERELRQLVPPRGPGAVIVGPHTPIVTSTALRLLLRTRRHAEERGVSLVVVAGGATARRVFGIARLSPVLCVRATLTGARSVTRSCRAGAHRGNHLSDHRRSRSPGLRSTGPVHSFHDAPRPPYPEV